MFDCTFELNDLPLSAFQLLGLSYPAFSGLGNEVNRRSSVCIPHVGPIPLGTYYIVDRESGGLLASIRDRIGNRREWFALYAADSVIDDRTYCNEVERGNFRLHPKVGRGQSKGCITIENIAHFNHIRAILTSATPLTIPGTSHKAYGKVVVK